MSLRQPVRTHSTENEANAETEAEANAESESSPEELLTLLDDEHARTILEAIQTKTEPARALADECGVSRPTVYRRLNALEEAGLVESHIALDADGHHRTVFESTLQSVTVDVTDDGLSITVERGETETAPESHGNRSSKANPHLAEGSGNRPEATQSI